MKHLVILLCVLAACRTGGGAGPARQPGAPAPRAALEQFLGAVRSQDLQAMSIIWGSERGPARDIVERDQLEKRELIMQCYLSHDKFDVLSEARGQAGELTYLVALTRGDITRETTFTTVRGPADRWYVLKVDLEPLHDLCAGASTG